MPTEPGPVTQLLHRWKGGDREAENELFEMLQPDLRRLAAHYMKNERPGHTLQPTALLSQAYMRLNRASEIDWRDRAHFFAIAATAMRRELIDHARKRRQRGPAIPLDLLPDQAHKSDSNIDDVVAVDLLLDELQREHPELATAIELKSFLGLTDEECADAMQVGERTFQRYWMKGRQWLFQKLNGDKSATNAS